jgi:hypothetical protein
MDHILRTVLARAVLASVAGLLLLPFGLSLAEPAQVPDSSAAAAAAANQIAEFFGKVGDQIYEDDCIFELSPEQIEVQHALVTAYIKNGASSALARQLAVKQIQPPTLSPQCEKLRHQPRAGPGPWEAAPPVEKPPKLVALPTQPHEPVPPMPPPAVALANKKMLPRWDCAPNVDYVTIRLGAFTRKLTGGEICNPYEDVVRKVPASVPPFRFGYTIATGRLFVVADNTKANGRTIAWAISGRDVCRNNPDPDCLASRGMGSLPPGEYAFSGDKKRRVTWGPKTKRNVAAIYLKTLWNRDRFTRQQTAAILKRGNIAIHQRLKGEMSEACIGLEPKGWAYVASLIKEGRATGVNVYLDEPYPRLAEKPPVVVGSSFSLTSLFKY